MSADSVITTPTEAVSPLGEERTLKKLVEQFKAMRNTSKSEYRKAAKRGHVEEAIGRHAEVCTLNVVIYEIDAALSTRTPEIDPALREKVEQLADDLRFFYVNWHGVDTAIEKGRRDLLLKAATTITALLDPGITAGATEK